MIDEFNGDFLQWLRGFYFVARTGSFSKAALKMNRSQSSVSYQIQSLERELNVVLFKRVNNVLHITPQGTRLLDWAVSAFELFGELQATLYCSEKELSGKVCISGSMPIISMRPVSCLITEFMHEHPKVQVQLRACRPREAIGDIDEGVSDIGLIALTRPLERYTVTPICSAKFILVAPGNHSFELDATPTKEQLSELPFIMYMGNDRTEMYTPWLTKEELDGLTGKTVMTVNQYQLVLEYIYLGTGCAIMDTLSLEMFCEYKKNVSVYPLHHYLNNLQYSMISRKQRTLSPAASALCEQLLELFPCEEREA